MGIWVNKYSVRVSGNQEIMNVSPTSKILKAMLILKSQSHHICILLFICYTLLSLAEVNHSYLLDIFIV